MEYSPGRSEASPGLSFHVTRAPGGGDEIGGEPGDPSPPLGALDETYRRPFSVAGLLAGMLTLCCIPAAASAQVTITGGLNRAERQYVWTVSNNGNQPVVSVQIPHYRGNIFEAPEGWEFEITNKAEVGMKNEPGLVTARATGGLAIRPGQSAEFRLRFAPGNLTAPADRVATVTLIDGSTLSIPGVEVPWPIPWLTRYGQLVVFGAIFLGFLIIQALRNRRKKA